MPFILPHPHLSFPLLSHFFCVIIFFHFLRVGLIVSRALCNGQPCRWYFISSSFFFFWTGCAFALYITALHFFFIKTYDILNGRFSLAKSSMIFMSLLTSSLRTKLIEKILKWYLSYRENYSKLFRPGLLVSLKSL